MVDRFGAKLHEVNDAKLSAGSPHRGRRETLLLALHGYSDPKANEQDCCSATDRK